MATNLNDIFGDGSSGGSSNKGSSSGGFSSGGSSSSGQGTPVYSIISGVKATVSRFENTSGRTIYAAWTFGYKNVKHYQVRWKYKLNGKIYTGEDSTTTNKYSSYTAPSGATTVYFNVKPVPDSKDKMIKNKVVWSAVWSTTKTFAMKNTVENTPPAPTVEIDENLKMTMYVNNLSVAGNGTKDYLVRFQVVRDLKTQFATLDVPIKYNQAKTTTQVLAGHDYRVRCKIVLKNGVDSEWSDWTDPQASVPGDVVKITRLEAFAKDSVLVDWDGVKKAEEYEIQYTYRKGFFDSNPDEVKSQTVTAKGSSHAEVTGLETGKTWFFRVRAKNAAGYSKWSEIASITLGEKPTAPTTWSSTTVCMVGEKIWLYWVHNSADGSKEKSAKISWKLGEDGSEHEITIPKADQDDDTVQKYEFDTSQITSIAPEGTIYWKVQTLGIAAEWGDWSAERVIECFSAITLNFDVGDQNGNIIDSIKAFPIRLTGIVAGNNSTGVTYQKPVGYFVSVYSNESYERVDEVGNISTVAEGEAVFSKYYDTDQQLDVLLYPDDIDLEEGVTYTFRCSVGMDSGLTDEQEVTKQVTWTDNQYLVNATLWYNPETYTCMVNPYATLEDGETLATNVTLSVYRRTFDGRFVLIEKGMDNSTNQYATDPHPALDYGRYRIVCIDNSTGSVSYADLPGYEIHEACCIIQWNEIWQNFQEIDEEGYDGLQGAKPWAGSLLTLPFNIDINEDSEVDVELVNYIGREDSTSYYGTHIGQTQSWTIDIAADDNETIYGLRRLASWRGDVYVREPSGIGYWATVKVHMSRKYRNTIVPVTIDITRVEGGA